MNETEICNLALSYIGKGRINSLDDASEEAKKCRVHYDHDRRRLLMMFPWGFAKRTEKLALLEASVPGWRYVYAFPAGCLWVRYVFDAPHAREKAADRQEFEAVLFGAAMRAVATDVPLAYAQFVADVRNTDFFSALFVEALSHLLAASIAMGVTGSGSLAEQKLRLCAAAVEQARGLAAVEADSDMRYPRKYQDARFS